MSLPRARRNSTVAAALLASLLLGLLFLATVPAPRTADTPPLWDESRHDLRSHRIAASLQALDGPGFVKQLKTADVYPPGYFLAFGAWMAIFGESAASVHVFQFAIVCVGLIGIGLISRGLHERHRPTLLVFGAACLGALSFYLALSHTMLLDAAGGSLTLLSLGALISYWTSRHNRDLLVVLTVLLLALFVKYNFGLAALAVAGLVAVSMMILGDRPAGLKLGLVALICLGAGAAFLSWQDQGWASFGTFIENRSNTADWSPWYRFYRYIRVYLNHNYLYAWQGLVAIGLAIASLRWFRRPVVLIPLTYLAISVSAISTHTYFLDRNSVPASMSLIPLTAFGVVMIAERIRTSKTWLSVAVVASVIGILLLGTVDQTRVHEQRFFPDEQRRLEVLSSELRRIMQGADSLLVTGTFDDFPGPWVETLWMRSGHDSLDGLRVELPRVVARTRTENPSHYVPEYRHALDRWIRSGRAQRVVTVRPFEGSHWRDAQFEAWNAWKLNYIDEFERHPRASIVARTAFEEAEVEVLEFEISAP